MSTMTPGQRRIIRRLAIASVLIVVVGISLGLDSAMAVAFSLAVMEIDALNP
jgi:NH3-dependent NAD+ synthetase